MKNWMILLFVAALTFASCVNNDDEPIVAASVQIEQYLMDNNITGETTTSTGLIYLIDEPGGAEKPALADTITINYSGYITDGTVFDETTGDPRTFPLRNLIAGWQEGIPLIGRGGKIKLICPPNLAYGNSPRGDVIKAGSVLVFDIELVDF